MVCVTIFVFLFLYDCVCSAFDHKYPEGILRSYMGLFGLEGIMVMGAFSRVLSTWLLSLP